MSEHVSEQGTTRRIDPEQGLSYYVLDVFTDTRFKGNPLAVVFHDGSLSTETMQAIAREMNLSETTFVQRRDVITERTHGVRVRIFTTEEELRFAGHPTLGTASLLRRVAPECVDTSDAVETVRLALNVGTVPVRFEATRPGAPEWPMRGEMTQPDPEFGAVLDPARVAELTHLAETDFDPELPIQVTSTGTAFAIVPLRSAAALANLHVDQRAAGAYLRSVGARWFYVVASEAPIDSPSSNEAPHKPARWRARMQFHGGEDPATGSAAGCAISHLVRHGAVASGEVILVRQGVEIGRESHLFLAADASSAIANPASAAQIVHDAETSEPAVAAHERTVTNVRVGGSTVLVATGTLFWA